MSTITNNARFITVVKDDGDIIDFRKATIKYSIDANDLTIQDKKYFVQLDYSLITSPASANIGALRDLLNGYIT